MALRFKVGEHARVAYVRFTRDPFWVPGAEVVILQAGYFKPHELVDTDHGAFRVNQWGGNYVVKILEAPNAYAVPSDPQLIKLVDPDGIDVTIEEEATVP